MFTPFEGGLSGYSSSWNLHARLNKACLRQPLCSFCCQCYVDIVSHKMRRDTLLLWCCCCGPHTARSCIHPWHGYVIGKFSSVISSVEREKKIKNQEKVWLRIIRAVSSIFSLSRLTWVNCLFRIPLANVFVLVVVCGICFPWKEAVMI